jgi:hypothetical protein
MTRQQAPPVPLSSDEEIAEELERVAQMVRERPELNNHAADRLLKIARSIRADAARANRRSAGRSPRK